mgnify:CR=1 FL=1
MKKGIIDYIDSSDERTFFIHNDVLSNHLDDTFNEFVREDKRDAVIDLAAITKLNSMTLAAFLRIKKKLNEKNRNLYLSNPSPGVLRVLELAGLDSFLLD